MPARPKRACPQPQCPHVMPCPDHTPKPWASSTRKGSTRQWRKLRNTILTRDPICVLCGVNPSTVCDHYPIAKADGGADIQSNLRGICSPCDRPRSSQQGTAARYG